MAGGWHIGGNQKGQGPSNRHRCSHSLHGFLLTIEVRGRGVSWVAAGAWRRAPDRYDRFRLQLKYGPDGQADFWRGIFFGKRQEELTAVPVFWPPSLLLDP